MKNQLVFLIFLFYFFTNIVDAHAQTEQLDVDGGIETDSLKINDLPSFRAETTADFDWPSIPDDTIQFVSDWVDSPMAGHQTVFDIGDNFDPITGTFTVPRTGLYYLRVELIFRSKHFFDEIIHSYISVNGSVSDRCIKGLFTLISGGNTGATPDFARLTRSFGGILQLNKGDMITLQMAYIDEAGFKVFVMEPYTSFCGYLITDLD